jgi:PKD repeat protein
VADRVRVYFAGFVVAVLLGSALAGIPSEASAGALVDRGAGVGLSVEAPAPHELSRARPTTGAPSVGAAPRPAAQTVSVTGASPSLLSLSWSEATVLVFSSYSIDQSTDGAAGPWTTVGTVTTETQLSEGIGELTPGSTSWWEVVANGLSSATSNVVEYTQPPAATLTFLQPSGSTAQLNWTNNASYGGDVGFVAYDVYESVDNGAASVVASLPTVATLGYTLTGLVGGSGYSVYVQTTDCTSCGTGSAVQAGTDSNTVTFGTPLPLTVSVHADRSTIDVNESDLFSCSASGGTAPYNYTWDNGSDVNLSGSGSQSFAFSTLGTANVTCLVTDSARSVESAETPVTVNADPAVNLTISEATPDVGELVSFACDASGGTAPFASDYLWNFGDGTTVSTSGPTTTHRYSVADSTGETASCVATDAAQVAASGSRLVAPFAALRADITVAATTVAPGTQLQLDASLVDGSGHYTHYAWTLPNGDTVTTQTVSFQFGPSPDPANFTVAGTDSVGGSANASVTVTIAPIVSDASVSKRSVETGHAVAFTEAASGGAGGPYTILWSFGNGANSTAADPSYSYGSPGTYVPTLRITDRLGVANVTTLAAITVSAPPPLVPSWLIVVLVVLVVAVVVALLYFRQRRRASEKLRSSAPWAPPTAPNSTVRGSKTCPSCGSSNVPLRSTCEVCGSDLPRSRSAN